MISIAEIDAALAGLGKALSKYVAIQEMLPSVDVAADAQFQRKFNGFYRVRRSARWRSDFYEVFSLTKSHREADFRRVLSALQSKTGRVEKSFASKLIATLNPRLPVIDKYVLSLMWSRVRPQTPITDPIEYWAQVHHTLERELQSFAATDKGQVLIEKFDQAFPGIGIEQMKKVDLVLWQTRRPNAQDSVLSR